MAHTAKDLEDTLERLDGRGYKAYKDLKGSWSFPRFKLVFDHVQGDPFASPSAVSVLKPIAETGLPGWALDDTESSVATRDFLARVCARSIDAVAKGHRGSGKGGLVDIDRPGQEVIERSAVTVEGEQLRVRCYVGLPAHGRRIAGRDAKAMLIDELPHIVDRALEYDRERHAGLEDHVHGYRDAEALRRTLSERGWVTFIADGSILPRRSGVDARPMARDEAVGFEAPGSLRRTVELPHAGEVSGMAVPAGVTVICGGGYHGKSTLLDAVSAGIYNHIPGDGRELVVTTHGAVKIRAEDGRRIERVSITPFISNLPKGRDTEAFQSEDASGSTSQAANIIEALEVGADLLLIDEDTSATNFMIRDHRMQELIAKRDEPITPFIDRVRTLSEEMGVSTLLVIGGSGDYFDVADLVIAMREYEPSDVTDRAREIAERYRAERVAEGGDSFGNLIPRAPIPRSINPRKGKRDVRTRTRGTRTIEFGTEDIDLTAVEQLFDSSQLNTIAEALVALRERANGSIPLSKLLHGMFGDGKAPRLIDTRTGRLAAVRPQEVAAALNRLRSLAVRQLTD